MSGNRFDQVTAFLGSTTSRRQVLQVLAGTTSSAVLAFLGFGCDSDNGLMNPNSQDEVNSGLNDNEANKNQTTTANTKIEKATDAQIQEFLLEAEESPAYLKLKGYFESFDFSARSVEGAILLRDNIVETWVVVLVFTHSQEQESILLSSAYNIKTKQKVTFSITLDSNGNAIVGHYVNQAGEIDIEIDNSTSIENVRKVYDKNLSANGTCIEECTSSCENGLDESQNWYSCPVAGTAFCALVVWRAALAGAILGPEGAAAAGVITSVACGLVVARGCFEAPTLTCNYFCTRHCDPCSDVECPRGYICVNGGCRPICGSTICAEGEICAFFIDGQRQCTAPPGVCSNGTYMGMYRFGNRLAPVCCPFNGIDCGATTLGTWAGCCPTGTKCCPTGIGFGCYLGMCP